MEKTCPYCNQIFENINGKVFSNHVRWCSANTTNGDKGRANISKAGRFERIKVKKPCLKCKKEFEVE